MALGLFGPGELVLSSGFIGFVGGSLASSLEGHYEGLNKDTIMTP